MLKISHWLSVIAMLCLGMFLLGAAGGPQEEFRHDFRQKTPPPGSFKYIGKDPQQYIRPDGTGLKIILPAGDGKKPFPQTGLKFNRVVMGDFEITMEYEVNRVDQPTVGYGSGMSIFLQTDSPNKSAATIAALLPVSGGMRFVTSLHKTEDDGKRSHNSKGLSVGDGAQKGILQLVRKGKELCYLTAQAEEPAPRELRRLELGGEPVTLIRLVADPGGSSTGVQVTIKKFEVKADQLTLVSEQLMQTKSSVEWIAAAVAVVVLTVGGIVLWRKPFRRSAR